MFIYILKLLIDTNRLIAYMYRNKHLHISGPVLSKLQHVIRVVRKELQPLKWFQQFFWILTYPILINRIAWYFSI